MRITSHATGIVDATVLSSGRIIFSVPEYYIKAGRRSRRQIMETGENGEGVMATIERALDDEISSSKGSATLELKSIEPFFVWMPKDEDHPGGTHLKAFFFASVTGLKRNIPKMDGNEELGPMIDIGAEELIKAMEDEGTVPIHLDVTKAAVAVLAQQDSSVAYYYLNLLPRCKMPPKLGGEEWHAIKSYSKWFPV